MQGGEGSYTTAYPSQAAAAAPAMKVMMILIMKVVVVLLITSSIIRLSFLWNEWLSIYSNQRHCSRLLWWITHHQWNLCKIKSRYSIKILHLKEINKFLNNQYQASAHRICYPVRLMFQSDIGRKGFFSSNPGQFALAYNYIVQALYQIRNSFHFPNVQAIGWKVNLATIK